MQFTFHLFSFCSTYYCYFNICNRYHYILLLLVPEARVLYSLDIVQGSTESNWQVMCTATSGSSQTNDASFVLVCLQMRGMATLVARSVTAHDPLSLTPLDVPKPIAKLRYCCSVCSKQFTTSSGLQIHEDGHLGRYRYRCTFCGKGFAATSNLRGHMSLHTGVIKFKCSKCGRKIRYEGDYRRHLTVCQAVSAE